MPFDRHQPVRRMNGAKARQLEHFPAKRDPVSRKKMRLANNLRVFYPQNRYPLLRNTRWLI
jgi:hypothetical protein